MMAKKRILSWLVAASLALSLLPTAAFAVEDETVQEPTTPPTLSEEVLAPGKDDVIQPADDAANKLSDAVNESGTDAAVDQANDAAAEAGSIDSKIDETLKVEVPVEGSEAEEGATEEKNVDVAIADEAAKAEEAKKDAEQAAKDAEAAVEAEDEAALAQAKKDAADAVVKADEAYNNAQDYFDTVIDRLLGKDDEQAFADKVQEILKDVAVPGEDATEEEKAAYESAKVDAENKAKLELANGKIDLRYEEVQKLINEAKAALEAAQGKLADAQKSYEETMKEAQDAAGGVDIDDYVKYFDELQNNPDKVNDVTNAYDNLDSAEKTTKDKQTVADAEENNLPEDQRKANTADRIERDQDFLSEKLESGSGTFISGDFQLRHAVKVVQENSKILVENMEQLKTATDAEEIAQLKANIEAAKKSIYDDLYDYGGTVGTLLQSPYDLIKLRSTTVWNAEILDKNKGILDAMDCLAANLETVEAQYQQMLVEQKLKETLDGLKGGLSYKEALDLVNTIANDENLSTREELKDAADKLAAQKDAAQKAAENVNKANEAYNKAQQAVIDALERLKALEEKGLDSTAAKQQLADAKGNLDQAKKDKEDAEDEKKKADDAVIETEEEIEDIITGGDTGTTPGGGTGGTGTTGGAATTIADGDVPLALMPTRGELMNYLYVRSGSPEAAPSTFTEVPADHEFAPAIGWAQANGIANGYKDGTFDPDNYVIASHLVIFLTNYAEFSGMTVSFPLKSMTGLEADDIVANADEVLAEFFGEEFVEAA